MSDIHKTKKGIRWLADGNNVFVCWNDVKGQRVNTCARILFPEAPELSSQFKRVPNGTKGAPLMFVSCWVWLDVITRRQRANFFECGAEIDSYREFIEEVFPNGHEHKHNTKRDDLRELERQTAILEQKAAFVRSGGTLAEWEERHRRAVWQDLLQQEGRADNLQSAKKKQKA